MSIGENEGKILKTLLIVILVITAITLVYLFIHDQSVREAGVPSDVSQMSEEASAASSCESSCPVDACDALTGTDKQTCLLSCFAGKCGNEGAKKMAEKSGKAGIGCLADGICNEFCADGTDVDCAPPPPPPVVCPFADEIVALGSLQDCGYTIQTSVNWGNCGELQHWKWRGGVVPTGGNLIGIESQPYAGWWRQAVYTPANQFEEWTDPNAGCPTSENEAILQSCLDLAQAQCV